MSVIFACIRARQHHRDMAELVCRIGGVSTAFVSLLRGSFDYVLPCTLSADGKCRFPDSHSGDSVQLESCLRQPILGSGIDQLLATDLERQRFASYVQNAFRQGKGDHVWTSESTWPSKVANLNFEKEQMPHVAHILQVRLANSINAMIHLSLIPTSADQDCHAVIALKLASQEEDEGQYAETLHITADKPAHQAGRASTDTTSTGDADPDLFSESLCASNQPESDSPECRNTAEGAKQRRLNRSSKLIVRLLDRQVRSTARTRGRRSISKKPRGCRESFSNGGLKVGLACGGSDVGSQSSKISGPKSVVLACRQLLGPLHEGLPPAKYISRRIEDHVQCSAEMVKLKAAATITRHHFEERMADWKDKAQSFSIGEMLRKSPAPDSQMTEELWRSQVLPHLPSEPPESRPIKPHMPADDELWHRAWKQTYESDSDSEAEGGLPLTGTGAGVGA